MGRQVGNKGYLLVEVGMAIAIVAVSMAIIIRSFSTALKSASLGLDYTKAALALEENLWNLDETALREDGLPDDLPEGGQVGEYQWSLSREKIEDTDIEQAVVSVFWEAKKRKEGIFAATYFKEKKE